MISCALICLRTGVVLKLLDGVAGPRLVDLASAASTMLYAPVPEPLTSAFARQGSAGGPSFQELSFSSSEGAYVLQQLDPELAIIAVSSKPEQLGAVIAAARARRFAHERST